MQNIILGADRYLNIGLHGLEEKERIMLHRQLTLFG
jgi:hypothetical protein